MNRIRRQITETRFDQPGTSSGSGGTRTFSAALRTQRPCSDQDWVDDRSGNIGQPEVSALVVIGQSRVIQPQEVKKGGLEIVNVDPVPDPGIAKFVGLTEGESPLQASAGNPH